MSELRIKIVGVGGAGVNIAEALQSENLPNTKFFAVDCDAQTLEKSSIANKLHVGHSITRGLSTGGDPSLGKKIFTEDFEKFEAIAANTDLVFVLSGLGGGFATSIAPLFSELAKSNEALVINFATLPFNIEGGRRYDHAETGLSQLRNSSHASIPLPNDLLLQNLDPSATVLNAFNIANIWALKAIQSILYVLYKPGIINLDFASLCELFKNSSGKSLFGLAQAEGEHYVRDALESLQLCPLLHIPQASQSADALLINIIGGKNLSLKDVNHVGSILTKHYKSSENTQIGAVIDDSKEDYLHITIIGTATNTRPLSKRKSRSKIAYANPKQQDLFSDFSPSQSDPTQVPANSESRGYFSETDKNLYQGEDMDIPTYLRRGINITL